VPPKPLQIRNSTAEFLNFTKQAGENGIEVRVQDGTIWLSKKLMEGTANEQEEKERSNHTQFSS